MLLVAFLAMSFPFGSAEIQMCYTIHYSVTEHVRERSHFILTSNVVAGCF